MLKNVKFFRIGRNSGVILFQPIGSPFKCLNLKILVVPSLPTDENKSLAEMQDFFHSGLSRIYSSRVMNEKSSQLCWQTCQRQAGILLFQNGVN